MLQCTVSELQGAYEEDALVDGVEDALQQCHDHKLQGTDLADQTAEGDQQGCHKGQASVQGEDVHGNIGPGALVPHREEPLQSNI